MKEERILKVLGISRVVLRMMNLPTQCSVCENDLESGLFILRLDSIVCPNCYQNLVRSVYNSKKSSSKKTINHDFDIDEIEEEVLEDFYEAFKATLN